MSFRSRDAVTYCAAFVMMVVCTAPTLASEWPTSVLKFQDSHSGLAVVPDSVLVNGEERAGQVKPNGALKLALPPGEHAVSVQASGYQPFSTRHGVTDDSAPNHVLLLDPSAETLAIQTQEVPAGFSDEAVIAGYVVDDQAGQPIEGAQICVTTAGGELTVASGSRGFYAVRCRLKPEKDDGSFVTGTLKVSKPGYQQYTRTHVLLPAGDVRFQSIRLQPGTGDELIDESSQRGQMQRLAVDRVSMASDQVQQRGPEVESDSPSTESTAQAAPTSIRVGRSCSCKSCSSVISVSMETYVKHVLPAEWISSWNAESLKAGAIAIRSYGAYHVYHPVSGSFDICDNSCCQVYQDSTVGSTNAAADATSGVYVVNSSTVIGRAEYSSENNNSCGDCWTTNNPDDSVCLSDSVCCGTSLYGHGRGMCQWGTQRWANNQGRTYDWITDHYFAAYGWHRAALTTPPPVITSHPVAQSVAVGGTATFTVSASGTGTLNYQWQKNNVNLSNGGHYSGANTATLTVTNADGNDVANYRCAVSNAGGTVYSNQAPLSLQGGGGAEFIVESRSGGKNYGNYSEVGPWVDGGSKSSAAGTTAGIGSRYSSTMYTGRQATFTFGTTTGTYDVYVTWGAYANRRAGQTCAVTHAGGTSTLTIDQSASSDTWVPLGRYNFNSGAGHKVVYDPYVGSSGNGASDAVRWVEVGGTVDPPTITQHPVAADICPGASTSFTVAASGTGTLAYQWRKNSSNLSNGGHYSGVTTTTLSVSAADANDVGSYNCVVTNTGGSTPSNAAALTLRTVTQITQSPSSLNGCAGGSVQFNLAAVGHGSLSYRWQKGTVDLADGGHYSGTGTGTLTISNLDATVTGTYRCVVTGGCGVATSDSASLSLNAATTITQQPSSQLDVPIGNNVSFTVAATGAGTITYQWQKNSVNLSNGGHISGATTATLLISTVDSSDAGNYRCVVTAGCGAVNSNEAVLGVNAAGIPGDFDGDGDLDLDDFAAAQRCLSGQGVLPSDPLCALCDLDHDNDVDYWDLIFMKSCFSGADLPGDPGCPPF